MLAWGGVGTPRSWYDSYEVDSTTVTVTYSDSPCHTFEKVDAEATDHEVTITVRTWTFAFPCSDALHPYTAKVRLDRPLGRPGASRRSQRRLARPTCTATSLRTAVERLCRSSRPNLVTMHPAALAITFMLVPSALVGCGSDGGEGGTPLRTLT